MASHCKTITVAQQKGGAGKTTLAAHLAIALTQQGNKVAVIDIDPQGSLSHWHEIRTQKFGDGYTGIHFVSKSGWRIHNEITASKTSFDYIIIDSPPHNETDAKTAIRASDLILIPLQPSPTDLWATQTTIDFCKANNTTYYIALNRVNPHAKILPSITKNLQNILKSGIGNRVAFASSMLEGRCVTEMQPNSTASLEIKALTGEIIKILNTQNELQKKTA